MHSWARSSWPCFTLQPLCYISISHIHSPVLLFSSQGHVSSSLLPIQLPLFLLVFFLLLSYLATWRAGRGGASKFTEIYMDEPDPFALTCIFDTLLFDALCMITSIYGYCLYCCSTCKVKVRRACTPRTRTHSDIHRWFLGEHLPTPKTTLVHKYKVQLSCVVWLNCCFFFFSRMRGETVALITVPASADTQCSFTKHTPGASVSVLLIIPEPHKG